PDQTLYCDVDRCGDCGSDLVAAPVARMERRQVTDIAPPQPPYVTEYRIITRTCPGCAAPRSATAPQGVPTRCVRASGARHGRGADLRALPADRPSRPRCWRPWPGRPLGRVPRLGPGSRRAPARTGLPCPACENCCARWTPISIVTRWCLAWRRFAPRETRKI